MNDAGLAECYRVVRPKGIVIVKSQDYVTSGKLYPGTHYTLTAALAMGFTLEDRLEHLGHVRPQPARTRRMASRSSSVNPMASAAVRV